MMQTGGLDFARLVNEIAFGDHHYPVGLSNSVQGVSDAIEKSYGLSQHVVNVINENADVSRGDGARRRGHRCFDHRKAECFDAIARYCKVAELSSTECIFEINSW